MKKIRILALLTAVLMIVSALAACGGTNESSTAPSTPAAPADASSGGASAADGTFDIRGNTSPTEAEVAHVNTTLDDSYLGDYFEFPLPSNYDAYPIAGGEDITLDVFYAADSQFTLAWSDPNEHPMVQLLEDLLGVHINMIVPSPEEVSTQLNLLISNGDTPDIIIGAGMYYPGGIPAGVEDGVYLDLTDYMDKMPNYSYIFEHSDSFRRAVTTDDGRIQELWGFGTYAEGGSEYAAPYICLNVKQEALDKTNMAVPETIDEMHDFLVACKEAGYEYPLSFRGTGRGNPINNFGYMFDAWGMEPGIYVTDEGKVAYGNTDDRAIEYIKTFNQWYQEGLIQPDWATLDFSQLMAYCCSEVSACTMESPDTMDAYWRSDNGIAFTYGNNLVLNKGDTPSYNWMLLSRLDGTDAVVSADCEHLDAALAFLDFGMTKKGWEVYNWGAYGEEYHLIDENGIPYYPEDSYYYNNPDGLATSTTIWKYRFHYWPSAKTELIGNPLCTAPGSTSAGIRLALLQNHDPSNYYPFGTSFTVEESTRVAEIETELKTLTYEYYVGMMNGTRPLSDFAEYQKACESAGLEEYIAIYQAALDRFYAR